MKPFAELSNGGRARRLRQLAWNALRHYDLDCVRLSLVTNHLNGIFLVETPTDRWILRIGTPEVGHTRAHAEAEMEWLAALARYTEISVPRPLPARDGSLVVEESAPGVPEPRLCAIYSWVPGSNLASRLTLENIRRQGVLMARLHEHAGTFAFRKQVNTLVFDRVFYFPEPVVLFDPAYRDYLTGEQADLFRKWNDRAEEAIATLRAGGEPQRVLHGDLHQWNVRAAGGVLSPIDFEDLILGWPVQDIAISLYYYQDEKDFPRRRTAFRDGYESIRTWPERGNGEIDTFLAARGLGLLNFVFQSWKMLDMDPRKFSEKIAQRINLLGS